MRYTLLLLFVLFSEMLFANNVTVEQAQALATDFFKASSQTRNAASLQLQLVWDGEDAQTRSAGNAPAFYVFNVTDRAGFVIIAGDDVVMPVLGYSFTNHFVAEGMPDNLKNWMNGLRGQINSVREEGAVASVAISEAWRRVAKNSVGETVKTLETAKWDQTAPYNNECPTIDSKRTVTGCVATAVAILMKYHAWPDKGEGVLPGYTYKTSQGGMKTISERKLGHIYNWNKMPLVYAGNTAEDAKDEVATLMYDCGVMSQASFGVDGTGAVTQIAVQGLIKYMNYDPGAKYLMREWYSDEEWNELMKAEIEAGRPVLYGGANDKQEGHQFILDGYTSEDYFSVNWGWSGVCNGFYLLSSLDPNMQGVGGNSGGGFSVGQDAVLGIKKAQEGSSYVESLVLMPGTDSQSQIRYNGLSATTTDFQLNQPFGMTAAFAFNMGFSNFTGNVIFSLIDGEGKLKENISSPISVSGISPGAGSGWLKVSCQITKPLAAGDRIWLRYKSSNSSEWQRMFGAGGAVSEIIVQAYPTAISKVEEKQATSVFIDQNLVTVHSPVAIEEVVLYDLDGRMLQKTSAGKNLYFSLPVDGYPAGAYVLQVRTENGIEVHKFVKK